MRFWPGTDTWHVAARHLGFVAFLTAGRASPNDLAEALFGGIELLPDKLGYQIVSALIQHERAEFVEAA